MQELLEYGYLGLFIGSFLAATIIPLASEILLIGLIAIGGNLYVSIMVATAGNWLGGMTSYYLGYMGKTEWVSKYLRVKKEKVLKWKNKIDQYGSLLALFTWLAIIGDVIAIALGLFKINPIKVATFMLIGKCIRYVVWGYLTYYILI